MAVSNLEVGEMASCMGCQIGSYPFVYLGLPIGVSMKRKGDWSPIIEN